MKFLIQAGLAGLIALACATTPAAAAPEKYPSHSITLIVPFAPGSGTDITTRILAKSMSEQLGEAVVVINKPGANGSLGARAAAQAKPDGYVLVVGSATTHATNYAFYPGKLGYEPGNFDVVAGLGTSSVALYVPEASPWHKLSELVADAKSPSSRINCGSGNAVTQVACEIFAKQAGFKATTVPYKGNAQSLGDVVGGRLSFAFSDLTAASPFVDGKTLRPLAVAGSKRNPTLPNVATFREQGFGDFEITAWVAVFAPAGTPAPILERLNAVVRKAVAVPEMEQLRAHTGSTTLDMTLPEARAFVQAEVARWARYVDESGVKPEQ